MRNSSDGSDKLGKMFFSFEVVSLIEGSYFPPKSENLDRKSFLLIKHYKYLW